MAIAVNLLGAAPATAAPAPAGDAPPADPQAWRAALTSQSGGDAGPAPQQPTGLAALLRLHNDAYAAQTDQAALAAEAVTAAQTSGDAATTNPQTMLTGTLDTSALLAPATLPTTAAGEPSLPDDAALAAIAAADTTSPFLTIALTTGAAPTVPANQHPSTDKAVDAAGILSAQRAAPPATPLGQAANVAATTSVPGAASAPALVAATADAVTTTPGVPSNTTVAAQPSGLSVPSLTPVTGSPVPDAAPIIPTIDGTDAHRAADAPSSPHLQVPTTAASVPVREDAGVRSASTLAPEPFQQVADAIRFSRQDQTLTLRLDPPELGQLTIELTFDRQRLIGATIGAENADTNSLLRRSSDQLQRELSDAGFGEVTIDFAEGQRRPDAREDVTGLIHVSDIDARALQPKIEFIGREQIISADRIDLRL